MSAAPNIIKGTAIDLNPRQQLLNLIITTSVIPANCNANKEIVNSSRLNRQLSYNK